MPTTHACPDVAEYQPAGSGQAALLGHLEACDDCAQRVDAVFRAARFDPSAGC